MSRPKHTLPPEQNRPPLTIGVSKTIIEDLQSHVGVQLRVLDTERHCFLIVILEKPLRGSDVRSVVYSQVELLAKSDEWLDRLKDTSKVVFRHAKTSVSFEVNYPNLTCAEVRAS